LGADSSQPETAYVLGALDLAESSPTWTTAIDRLRTAAAAERGFGRARAALVYALATSGAADEARAELGKLEASGSTDALLGRLRAYVQRVAATAPSASAAGSAPPGRGVPIPASALPLAGPEAAPGSALRAGDFRKVLEDASRAKQSGDLATAEALYQTAQRQQPGNIEALAGLGDVARMRGNTGTAAGYYEAVLQQNPTYL